MAGKRRQQPVRKPEVTIGLDQRERQPASHSSQPDRTGDVPPRAEDGICL